MNPMQKHIDSVTSALPATSLQLMAKTGLSRSHVNKTLTIMRCLNSVHISEYAKTKEANAPVYACGAGVDAEYPKKPLKIKPPKVPKSPKEPKPAFKLPKRCDPKKSKAMLAMPKNPKPKIAIPDSPYRSVWVKTPMPQSHASA